MGLHVSLCLLGRLRLLFRFITCCRARVFSPLPLSCQRIATSPQGGGRFFFKLNKSVICAFMIGNCFSLLCLLKMMFIFVQYSRQITLTDPSHRPNCSRCHYRWISLSALSLSVLSITLGAGYPVVTKKRRSNVPKRDL